MTTTTTTTRAEAIAALDEAARRLRYRIRCRREPRPAWLAEARRRLLRVMYERARLAREEEAA